MSQEGIGVYVRVFCACLGLMPRLLSRGCFLATVIPRLFSRDCHPAACPRDPVYVSMDPANKSRDDKTNQDNSAN